VAPTGGRVRISTVHAAKGLEFRAVFVPGCELGLFPLAPSSPAPAEEPVDTAVTHHVASGTDPEERRVFYVAVTRAKEELTLSYCTFRRDSRTQPSPYLRELGSGLVRRAQLGTNDPPKAKKRARAPQPTPASSVDPGKREGSSKPASRRRGSGGSAGGSGDAQSPAGPGEARHESRGVQGSAASPAQRSDAGP
ncbi:MAG TPA: 3'-5' exonuclease, partial [Chloroflexota bacterium]|nr:3'-5' exonuclease [Chloroflexota bacterium]